MSRQGWLNRGVAGIGTASLFSDLGHEVPTSLLPAFLTSTLGAPAAALGLIEGIADSVSGAAKLAGGAVADDPHRRRASAIAGYTATPILVGLIGVTTAVWQVVVLRVAAWGARGFRGPSRNTLLADAAEPAAYGRAFGFERAMDNLGAIGGPLLALALVSLTSVRAAFLLSMIPGLMAAVAVAWAIRHIPAVAREHRGIRLIVRPFLRGTMGHLLLGVTVFEIGNVAATLMILRAGDLLGGAADGGPVRAALLLYAGYNFVATVASMAAGHLIDRANPAWVLRAGVGAFAAAYLLFASSAGIVGLGVAFALAGLGIGFVETGEHAAVATLAPERSRGSAFGLLAGIQSFGNLVASGVAGLLWTLVSPEAAFVWIAALMVVSLAALPGARRFRA